MGLKVYDLPPGGLEDGAVATPSKDVTFTWTYNQEELDKTEPLPKDIQIIKKTEPDASEDEDTNPNAVICAELLTSVLPVNALIEAVALAKSSTLVSNEDEVTSILSNLWSVDDVYVLNPSNLVSVDDV